jgi:hypothetical protein
MHYLAMFGLFRWSLGVSRGTVLGSDLVLIGNQGLRFYIKLISEVCSLRLYI